MCINCFKKATHSSKISSHNITQGLLPFWTEAKVVVSEQLNTVYSSIAIYYYYDTNGYYYYIKWN